ncbi:MAG: hypothetical protein Q7S22_04230 [Candidatus Micrarchaeota archaeon]|nr:hypothetical protein [Candidatus Micrarchaeota archaeon]
MAQKTVDRNVFEESQLAGVIIKPVEIREKIQGTATAAAFNTTARLAQAFADQLGKTPEGRQFMKKSLIFEIAQV